MVGRYHNYIPRLSPTVFRISQSRLLYRALPSRTQLTCSKILQRLVRLRHKKHFSFHVGFLACSLCSQSLCCEDTRVTLWKTPTWGPDQHQLISKRMNDFGSTSSSPSQVNKYCYVDRESIKYTDSFTFLQSTMEISHNHLLCGQQMTDPTPVFPNYL